MLGPYIDTLIICTMTGLVIISTGAWKHTEYFVKISASSIDEMNQALNAGIYQGRELFNSSLLTSYAFKQGLSFLFSFGDKIVTSQYYYLLYLLLLHGHFMAIELQFTYLVESYSSILVCIRFFHFCWRYC